MPIGVPLGVASALLTALVTEIYCHRSLAHRAFRCHPALALFFDTHFRVFVGTDPESWAGVHRLHHRYADMPLDPHSPRERQPLLILAGSPYLFAVARRRLPANPKGRGTIHVLLRTLVIAVLIITIGPVQTLVMFLVHLACYLGIMGMVNTVGHLYGRKPHPEASGYDLAWLAIPLLGHGYHNTHHAHPGAARTGLLDPIWPLIRGLSAVGLVDLAQRPARTPPPRCCRAAVLSTQS